MFWIANDYSYELNELKIIGSSNNQILFIFMFIGLIIGNLGYLLGVIASILIPSIISYLIALLTLQNVTLLPPTLFQIVEAFLELNFVIFLVTLLPAYQLSSKKILKQKTRE